MELAEKGETGKKFQKKKKKRKTGGNLVPSEELVQGPKGDDFFK